MKTIFKKSLLLVCVFALTFQHAFSQTKNKHKNKKHHSISINHQGKDVDISEGFWSLGEEEYGEVLQLSNHKTSRFSFKKGSFFISFYPTNDELTIINSSNSNFRLDRAAGTLNCNVLESTFTFTVNKSFESFLKDEDIEEGTSYDFMKLFLGDIDKTYVTNLKNEGYTPTLRQLGKLGLLDVSIDYIKSVTKGQYKGLDLDMITKFSIHNVTPEYIEGLNDLGYGDIDANMVKKFAIHSVSLDYIQGLNEAGYESLDANMIKKFAIHSVSVNYIKGLNDLGYNNLKPNDIKNFAVHSISLDYIESLINLEINKPTMSEIKKAKIHGVSANFVERAMRKGHNEKDLSDYVKLKIHGI